MALLLSLFPLLVSASELAERTERTERWAVVTGASSGIGAAIALEASRRGYSVLLAARREDQLHSVAALATQAGAPAALVVSCDLATRSGRQKLLRASSSRDVTLAVINAGFAYSGEFVEQHEDSIDKMIEVNVGALASLTRKYAEAMAKGGGGHILLTGSISGAAAGVPNAALYAATKAFVRVFSAGIRPELKPAGVAVTCLLPGATDTGFASVGGLETSSIFTLPGVRTLGAVLPASTVAAAALDAAEAGRAEVVPGFLNKAFVLFCALTPSIFSRKVAQFAFGRNPFKSTATKKNPIDRLRGGNFQQDAAISFSLIPIATLVAIGLNIAQNGRASHPAPICLNARDVLALRKKADAVALWRAARAPSVSSWAGKKWQGHLLPLGILAPASTFITHVLFGPFTKWTGKAFALDGHSGANTFVRGRPRRAFRSSIAKSDMDGRMALVLDYAGAGELLWGRAAGMRDELREVVPGVMIGIGSMQLTGGIHNAAMFVLIEKSQT